MVDTASAPIQGQDTATVQQAFAWALRHNPAIGVCEGSPAAGNIAQYLLEMDRLAKKVGMDFAVVAAHASAQTDGFSSPAWRESLNTLPVESVPGARGIQQPTFHNPRDAARAHIMFVNNLVNPNGRRSRGEQDEAVQALRDAGYNELLGELAQTPAPRSTESVTSLEELPTQDAGQLSRHLDGIRADVRARNEPGTPADAPPLPPIEWVPTDHYHPRPGGMRPVAICYHITDAMNVDGVLSWFREPGSGASSTFVLGRDGTAYQMISSQHAPWTNGDYRDVDTGAWNHPRTDIPWLNAAIESCERRENNLNDFFITYEFVGTPDTPPTDAQYETAIQLSRYFCHPSVYGIGPHRGRHLRHADINSVSRGYDPGPGFKLERIIQGIGGDPGRLAD